MSGDEVAGAIVEDLREGPSTVSSLVMRVNVTALEALGCLARMEADGVVRGDEVMGCALVRVWRLRKREEFEAESLTAES